MLRLVACLLLVAAFLYPPIPAPVIAQSVPVTSPIVLEDRSATAERLLEEARKRAEEFRLLEAAEDMDGVNLSDALQEQMPRGDVKSFRERYKYELRLAQHPDKEFSWRALGEDRLKNGGLADAYGAAWKLLDLAQTGRTSAAALDLFAAIMVADEKPAEALRLIRETLEFDKNPERRRNLNRLEARFTLRITDVAIDVEGRSPQACLVFSHMLKDPQPIPAADYIRFKSPRDIAIRAEGNRVCMTGFMFGDKTDVTILAGLKGQDGAELYEDTRRSFTIPDRTPRLLFGNGTYILPRVGDETVPLKSVNMASASLQLYRVPERGIVAWMKSEFRFNDLSKWDADTIERDYGESVWQGAIDIENERNSDVTTLVPVRDMLESVKPGIYALVASAEKAEKNRHWQRQQTQWLIISDLGLMTLSGDDGLSVFVNSLAEAKAVRGVHTQLFARNNTLLAEGETDRQGMATFDANLLKGEGGNRPFLIVAQTDKGDFAFLDLSETALDLSDRGSEGRRTGGVLDAFLYTERGIYRPGETVFISGMLRDSKARAVPEVPLTMVITRPDGVEAFREQISGNTLGAYAYDYALSPGARTGNWRVHLFADKEDHSIGATLFQVGAFVPERLKASLEAMSPLLTPGTPLETSVQADFLYGAPGAGLKGNMRISLAADSTPFENYKGYQFGLVQDDFTSEFLTNKSFETGPDGLARVAVEVESLPETSRPLSALISAEVTDVGGRPVSTRIMVPVRRSPVMIGLRADGDGGFADGEDAQLSVVSLDSEGNPLANRELTVTWIREHWHYSWYRSGNQWRHRSSTFDEVIGEETLKSDEAGTLALSRPMASGRYRVEVVDQDGNAAASTRFTIGWWMASDNPNVPDALELTIETSDVASGDRLRGFVKAPFGGVAMLTIVTESIQDHKVITLGKDGATFDFKVGKDWGPSAYILATALRPGAGEVSRLPIRATGLAWFSVNRKARGRTIAFDVPEVALPGTEITIPLRLEGKMPKGGMTVTVAAVDEGILRITGFRNPDPENFYLGKRGFTHDIRDLYGRLIRSEDGTRGTIRTGGDEMLAMAAPITGARIKADSNQFGQITRTRQAVAMVRRDVRLNSDGTGTVSFTLPDFLGRLRLMAVAYGEEDIGIGSDDLIVRTPIVADLITPRFLAPGDEAMATLSVQNLSGKDGMFSVRLASASDYVDISAPDAPFALKDNERRDFIVPLKGRNLGTATMALEVTGPDGTPVVRNFAITVRPAWPFATERAMQALSPGDEASATGVTLSRFFADTIEQNLAVSSRPNLEADRFFTNLYHYGYRCSEQTVSRAFPSLFHDNLDALYGITVEQAEAANMVDRAIITLMDRQGADGSFGLWGPFSSRHAWLDAYVTDFLLRAREKGYQVPDIVATLAINRLKQLTARRDRDDVYATAYAHYVLARYGEVSASETRYFADRFDKDLKTPLSLAHMGGALALVGEHDQAETYLVRAIRKAKSGGNRYHIYGSYVRDLAAIATVVAETLPNAGHMADLADLLEKDVAKGRWFSTQEMAWLARAAASFGGDGDRLAFTLDGKEISADKGFWKEALTGAANRTIVNTGNVPLRAVHTVRGLPTEAPAPSANGFQLVRSFYDLKGNPLTAEALPRNGRFVVMLSGTATALTIEDPLVVDLLPAGLEIETTDTHSLEFLGRTTHTEFEDARDDRYVAALKLSTSHSARPRHFRLAYIVRAITPGDYVLPGVFIEDMYQPEYRLQGETHRLTVMD